MLKRENCRRPGQGTKDINIFFYTKDGRWACLLCVCVCVRHDTWRLCFHTPQKALKCHFRQLQVATHSGHFKVAVGDKLECRMDRKKKNENTTPTARRPSGEKRGVAGGKQTLEILTRIPKRPSFSHNGHWVSTPSRLTAPLPPFW